MPNRQNAKNKEDYKTGNHSSYSEKQIESDRIIIINPTEKPYNQKEGKG